MESILFSSLAGRRYRWAVSTLVRVCTVRAENIKINDYFSFSSSGQPRKKEKYVGIWCVSAAQRARISEWLTAISCKNARCARKHRAHTHDGF